MRPAILRRALLDSGELLDGSRQVLRSPGNIAQMEPGSSLATRITVRPLWAVPEVLPRLALWMEAEWSGYYGPGGVANAAADLQSMCNRTGLDHGVAAFWDGQLRGMAALKRESIASHKHLGPWAAAGLVRPGARRQGIGAALLNALSDTAATLGYGELYCATATSRSLLERLGWTLHEVCIHEGSEMTIFRKGLPRWPGAPRG